MRFIEKIFSITNCDDKVHKLITICGLKIKYRKSSKLTEKNIRKLLRDNNNIIFNGVQRSITTAYLHQQTFAEYKNKYQGRTIVLVGAGPTVNYFDGIKDAIYVGCNRAFLYEKIKFDYLFSIDKGGLINDYQNLVEQFFQYNGENCTKFIGDQNLGVHFQIPESLILKYKNLKRYKTNAGYKSSRFTFDIATEPLGNFATVALQALQFIMYTNPAKVYLVGIDCNVATAGHFAGFEYDCRQRNEDVSRNDRNNIIYWSTNAKDFINIYYPETEIISVNPVGLRGVFKDVYTQNYLNANPQLKNEVKNIELLSQESEVLCK